MTDLDIARRRRAWHALRLGPLWVPVASALPGAHFAQAPATDTPAENGAEAQEASATVPPPDTAAIDSLPMARTASPADVAGQGTPQPLHAADAAPTTELAPTEPAHPAIPDPSSDSSSDPAPDRMHGRAEPDRTDAPDDAAWHEADQEPMLEPVFDDNRERDDGFGDVPAAPMQADAPAQAADRGRAPEPGRRSAEERTSASMQTPVPQPESRSPQQRWEALRAEVSDCQRCRLADTRTQTVFGRGRPGQARWLLIGEAPGAEEDRQGEAFVGQAGQLLDAMLRASGIDPAQEVFIANVLKCRPPGNRNPEPDEVAQCEHFLHEQIRLSDPDCILLLGRFAVQSVLHSELPIGRLRNKVHYTTLDERRIPVVVTYHPAYLLRNMQDKLRAWEDLCLAASVAGKADDGHTSASQPPSR